MCALTVVLCEIVLSLYGDPAPKDGYATVHQRSQTPGLTFEPIPGAATRLSNEDYNTAVRFNSYGLRGPEPSPPERGGVARIAAIGDSFTFGMGVEAEQAWPAQLESLLTREDRPVEVLNFGVCAYSIADSLAVLEHKTDPWHPRAVVFGYFHNDPDTLPLQPMFRAFQHPLSPFRLKLGYFSLMLRRSLDYKISGAGSYGEMLYSDKLSYWPETLAAFERMAAIAKERNTAFVVAIFPSTPDNWNEYEPRPLHAKLTAALRERGIAYIDMLDEFSRHDPAEVRIGHDDTHPTAFGHQLIAAALAPAVEAAIGDQAVSMR
jgi:lysophospholipase L1-like esterase